ncbi:hypothetical protein GPJ56_007402 [Histomonas meleagridis]|uniref:uncharacterized protein n=1 Tax=Histomonas meleagridis TaxID=135588 RepID=UPI00355A0276|nr:hypothetical protein GPJ56_007402 [Histomonas meleagridis]KAH0804248.1 hypothetical protein GO595_003078 [Histomonas meleagridis]
MFNFEQSYKTFAKICNVSSDCSKFKSTFPNLQNAATEKTNSDQDDVILWDSGAPIPCLLGKARTSQVDTIIGSVLLISCNTAFLIASSILEGQMKKETQCSIQIIYTAIKDTIKEQLPNFDEETQTLFSKYLEFFTTIEDHASLEDIRTASATIQSKVYSMFEIHPFFGDFVYLIFQFLLNFQSFGIIELASNMFQEFSKIEKPVIKALKLLLKQKFQSSTNKFQEINKILSDSIASMPAEYPYYLSRKYVIESLLPLTDQILHLCSKLPNSLFGQSFHASETEYLPIEFSQSFLSIFTAETVEHEYVKQLALSLNSCTNDTLLQYLCSGASYFFDEILGYTSIISSLLPIEPNSLIEHLSYLLQQLSPIFSAISNQFYQTIKASNINLDPSLNFSFNGINATITTPLSALQTIMIYNNIQPLLPEDKQEMLSSYYNNLVNISLSWIITITKLLRLFEMKIVEMLIDIIDIQYNLSNEVKTKILEDYNHLDKCDISKLDFNQIIQILTYSKSINEIIISKFDEIRSFKTQSFACFTPNFQSITEFVDSSISIINELNEILNSTPTTSKINTTIYQQNSSILLQKMFFQVDTLMTAISTQFEYVPSVLSNLRLQIFQLNLQIIPLKINVNLLQEKLNILSNENDVKKLLELSSEYQNYIQDLIQKVLAPRIDENFVQKMRLSNKEDVDTLIQKIDSPEIRNEILYEIHSIYENPIYRQEQKKIEINLKKVIEMRVRNDYPLDITKIAQLTEKEIYDNSLAIAAIIPLYAGENLEILQKQIAPLILRNSAPEIHQIVRDTLVQFTYSDPLNSKLNEIVQNIVNGETEIEDKIKEIAKTFNINNLPKLQSEDQEKIFYQLLTLLAYSITAPKGPFSDDKIKKWKKDLFDPKLNQDEIKSIVYEALRSSLLTAVMNNDYDVQLMYKYQYVLSALDNYENDQSDYNKRSLVASICLLPTVMRPFGEINMNWAVAVTLLQPSSINQLIELENETDFYQYISDVFPPPVKLQDTISTTSRHSSSVFTISRMNSMYSNDEKMPLMTGSDDFSDMSDDEEPVVIYQDVIEEEEVGEPETIEEIEEVFIEEDENEPINDELIQKEIAYKQLSESEKLLSKLYKYVKSLEIQVVNVKLQQFCSSTIDLIENKLLDKQKIISITDKVKSIVNEITDDDRSKSKELKPFIKEFNELTQKFSEKDSIDSINSKITLMNSVLYKLVQRMECPNEETLMNLDQIRRDFVINSPDILNSLREFNKTLSVLIGNSEKVENPKQILNALTHVFKASFMFYLMYFLYDFYDNELDMKCISLCRRMQCSMNDLISTLTDKKSKDYADLMEIYDEINEKLKNLMNDTDKAKGVLSDTMEYAKKKLDMQALLIKRRAELKEAEDEVKRLSDIE